MRVRTFNHHTLHPGHTGNSGGIHPCCELLYITKGQVLFEWNGEQYAGTAPCLFVLTPNTPHRLVARHVSVHFWYIELHVGKDDPFVTVEQAINWNRSQQGVDYGTPDLIGIMQTMESLVGQLQSKCGDNGEYDEEIVLLDIQKVVRLILNRFRAARPYVLSTTRSSTKDLIESLMRYMESNYAEPIDLTVLSKQVYLNSSYLVRAFKSQTGFTPMQYLNHLRLGAATSYLIHTEMGIQQIAEETGFNSIHYFSRLFKQRYGVSPQKWRAAQYVAKESI